MKAIPPSWAEYARVQSDLIKNYRLNDRSWGQEHALDQILVTLGAGQISDFSAVEKTISTVERRERYRGALRIKYLPGEDFDYCDPAEKIATFQQFSILEKNVNKPDLDLLVSVALGHSYSELAKQCGVKETVLRTRVSRLRRSFS